MRWTVIAATAALLATGCASVSTRVTLLEPARTLGPARQTEILLDAPERPHVTVAIIEARGLPGGTERELLEAAREEAERIGADGVVRLSVDAAVTQPVEIYDPVFSPFYSRYALRAGAQIFPPYLGHFRTVGGGTVLTLKARAIRYDRGI